MPEVPKTEFTLQEVAFAYALCAERLVASDPSVLNTHFGTVPVLVHLLYQSLEISLKHIGNRLRLLSGNDTSGHRLVRSHDVRALANAIQAGIPQGNLSLLLSAAADDHLGIDFIDKMLFAPEFEETRKAYEDRKLGYAQLKSFTVFSPYILAWISAIKNIAKNLDKVIGWIDFTRHGKSSDNNISRRHRE